MDNKEIIKQFQGYECLSACLGYFLCQNYSKVLISGISLYGGGFEAEYDDNTHTIGTHIYDSIFKFLEDNKLICINDFLSDELTPESFIHESLENKERIILKLNSGNLSYNRVFKQSEDSTHCVCLLDENENQYLISDCYVPTRIPETFYGYVDKKQILEAWKNKKYEYFNLKTIELNEEKAIERLKINLKNSLVKYIDNSKENFNKGENAIYRVLDYLKSLKDSPQLREITLYVNYQIKIYGFLSSKEMLLSWLNEMNRCEQIAEDYAAIIHEWNKICFSMIRYGLTGDENVLNTIYQKVNETVEKEHSYINSILKVFF